MIFIYVHLKNVHAHNAHYGIVVLLFKIKVKNNPSILFNYIKLDYLLNN